MPWDREHGCNTPGSNGIATHLGEPLTVDQISQLADGTEVVVTWSGGNGPWPYLITVDEHGRRYTDAANTTSLLIPDPEQRVPLHRVTLGWDEQARQWRQQGPTGWGWTPPCPPQTTGK
jgi:hypothetical protein